MALRLAAPQTWAASVIPALLGGALAREGGRPLLCLAAACVLMQAAANTFNDYSDFIKGADTPENCPDPADAVLVYARPAPEKALALGFAFLAAAALTALPVVLRAGWRALAVGAAGAAALLLYSLGKKPLSYLPIGETVSGFVMGGLIPLGVYGALTGDFSARTLVPALPVMLGVALIMLTNNACDIERDSAAGRRTLPVLLGRERTRLVYRALLLLWALLPLPLLIGGDGAAFYLVALLAAAAPVAAQLRLPLSESVRDAAMGGVTRLNVILGLAYIAGTLFGGAG